jgi:class 3 adenylate cyclase
LFSAAFIVHVITDPALGPTIGGFLEIVAYIAFAATLVVNSYFREMTQRKQYNTGRIIDIEIEKTEDLLSKLVPFHVLSGIKNDQRVVDVLDNVTLLYTDMVGFTAFSNNVKNPVEVVQLLSKLFSKFDQLTDAHGVYKVHTIGDCYVIMGYTGKTPKYRRTLAVQIEEAYRVVKVGLEMLDIIREVREASTDPNLHSLDMRIGIHTGKIVGGVIGSKLVRYDIFGQDVLIANKMESNGEKGRVCISETTLGLLKQNQFIVETLGFKEHNQFEVGHINKKITSYFVEQIFMSNSVHSSDISSHDYSSGQDDNSEHSVSDSPQLRKKTTIN